MLDIPSIQIGTDRSPTLTQGAVVPCSHRRNSADRLRASMGVRSLRDERGWGGARRFSCCRPIYHINNLLTLGASPCHDICVDSDAMTRQDWLLALRTFIVVYLIF